LVAVALHLVVRLDPVVVVLYFQPLLLQEVVEVVDLAHLVVLVVLVAVVVVETEVIYLVVLEIPPQLPPRKVILVALVTPFAARAAAEVVRKLDKEQTVVTELHHQLLELL
jgi:hypothetical protein